MNAYSTAANRNLSAAANATARPLVAAAASPSRPPHRQRDFGVGYGTSSGYASNRSYVSRNVTPLFRCV